MPNELNRKRRKLRTLAVGLMVAAACALSVTVWQIVQNETRMGVESVRAQRVIDHIRMLHEQFRVADTALRAFVLTGDESFATTFNAAVKDSLQQTRELNGFVDDNELGLVRLGGLEKFLTSRVEQGKEAIRIRREQGAGGAVTVSIIERSEKATTAAMTVLDHLLEDQQKQLELRREREARYVFLLHLLAYGLVGITQIGAVIIFWMHRWITKLQIGLVTICAWTKRVRHAGVWMEFDVYLERRFGLRVTHGMSEEVAEQFRQDITRLEKEDEGKRPG